MALRASIEEPPLLGSAKPLALLAYLGLSPRARAHRDHVAKLLRPDAVAKLLWPDADLTDARHSLRQSLYRLRSEANETSLVDAVARS